jgi:hypothetical protein
VIVSLQEEEKLEKTLQQAKSLLDIKWFGFGNGTLLMFAINRTVGRPVVVSSYFFSEAVREDERGVNRLLLFLDGLVSI